MRMYFRVVYLIVLATGVSLGQDFSQFSAGPVKRTTKMSNLPAPGAVTPAGGEVMQVAYETLSDTTESVSPPIPSSVLRGKPTSVNHSPGSGATVGTGIVHHPSAHQVLSVPLAAAPSVTSGPAMATISSPTYSSIVQDPMATGGIVMEGTGCDDGGCGTMGCSGGCSSCASKWGSYGLGGPGGGPQCGSLCGRTCPECCGVGTHYSHFYGEFLYLRARNVDVAYAVPIDGPIVGPPANNPIQIGSIGIVDSDYEAGFRGGMNVALDTVSSFDVSYSMYESLTDDQISIAAPNVLRSLVAHPSSSSAASDFLSASADLEIDFDIIDASYRHLLICREVFSANYVLGGRYAKLEQQFHSTFVENGTESVNTDIDFDGGGIKIGLETERYSCRHQFHVFANGYASFVAGRFRGSYFQGQSFDPTVVSTSWEAGRVVPILDLNIGAGWTSIGGKLRLTGGYMVNAWFNTLTTQEFIRANQGSDYVNLGQTITFDGLNARVEYRF